VTLTLTSFLFDLGSACAKKSRYNFFLPLPVLFINPISKINLLYFCLDLFTSSSVDPLARAVGT
jgi:hypothetical protein